MSLFQHPCHIGENDYVCFVTLFTHIIFSQVKNRLDPAYDSRKSAGYRDVSITIRIVNAETMISNVENHVCELQLILAPFFKLKVRTHKMTQDMEWKSVGRSRP